MRWRYMLSLLRILKIPGLFLIMKDWQALVRMHFLHAAFESGLFHALTIPSNRQTLLDKLQVQRPDLFDALLDVGVASRELGIKNQLYFIRGKRSKAIANSNGDILAAMVQANVTYYGDAYRNMADRLKGGELGDDLKQMGTLVARFSRIAEPILKEFISGIVSGKETMRILDVGCGSGVFLDTAHSVNQNATGIGLDSDEAVVRQAKENIAQWGLNEKFRILLGDIRQPPAEIEGCFDLITLFNILYYFGEEERADLLRSLAAMLAPGGVLAVAMNCHSRGVDLAAANLNVVNCSLKGLTRLPDVAEVTGLLKQCGFRHAETHRFIPGSTYYGITAANG